MAGTSKSRRVRGGSSIAGARKPPREEAAPAPAALRDHCVENDAFDRAMFTEMLEGSPVLQGLLDRGHAVFSPFNALLQDVFSSLYKYNIKLHDRDVVSKSNWQNRRFVEEVLSRPEYGELRKFTILNETTAAIGASSLAQRLIEDIERQVAGRFNEMKQREEDLQDAENAVESLEELLEKYGERPIEEKLREELEKAQQRLEEAQKRYDQQAEEIEAGAQEGPEDMERSLEQGFEQALEDVKENMEFMEGFGDEAGSIKRLSVDQRLSLAKKLKYSEKLKKLAKMVGKFKRLALAQQRRRVKQNVEEMYDVMLGNEIARLIPSELLALHHPILRKDFKRRYAEQKLLQYNLRGQEERGKGALVVCIDGSYSMEGEKELWSKAVTLAMLDIAARQKRNFRAIHFGSKKDPLKVMEFPKGERPEQRLEKIAHLAEYFIGGGTDFEKPLQAAIHTLEEDSKQRGDIVFITDGDCVVSPRWLSEFKKVKEKLEVSIYSVLVDMGINTPATVREFSDKVTTVSRLTSDEMKDIFAAL